MFERIFGKRKSLQRNLVIDLIICIIIVMFISLVGFYIFVNKETLNSLIQVNFENKEQIKEILGITRRSLVLLIINTILISTIVMRITSKKILQPIKDKRYMQLHRKYFQKLQPELMIHLTQFRHFPVQLKKSPHRFR